jgi:hypothetical protein
MRANPLDHAAAPSVDMVFIKNIIAIKMLEKVNSLNNSIGENN